MATYSGTSFGTWFLTSREQPRDSSRQVSPFEVCKRSRGRVLLKEEAAVKVLYRE